MIRDSAQVRDWMHRHGVHLQPSLSGTLHLSRTNAFFMSGGNALVNADHRSAAALGVQIRDGTAIDRAGDRFVATWAGGERIEAQACVVAIGGFASNRDWAREAWGCNERGEWQADQLAVRGTRFNLGVLLRDLLAQGANAVGDPTQAHTVAIDARAPLYDGSICTPDDWARIDPAARYRPMDLCGMSDMMANHLSSHAPGEPGAFLVNPYGMRYEEITASSLIKFDLDGNILAKPDFGTLDHAINRAGHVIHSAIHAARREVACVIHTRSRASVAVHATPSVRVPPSSWIDSLAAHTMFAASGRPGGPGPGRGLDPLADQMDGHGTRIASVLCGHDLNATDCPCKRHRGLAVRTGRSGWSCGGNRPAGPYTARAPRFTARRIAPPSTARFDSDTMFSWLFKKRGPATGTTAPASASSAATPAQTGAARRAERDAAADKAARQAAQAQSKAAQTAVRAAENWPGRLQQALGNDAALLEVASNAPGLDVKLAAVEGLAGEDALRQAERAFRARDRKVHRLAKSRLGAAVSLRTARATAEQLLQRGHALLQDPQLPLNHLATLDRDWQALPAALLEPAQHAAFTALRAQLDSTVRARADAEQQLQRWTAQTQRSLPTWQAAVAAASSQPPEHAHAALADVRNQAQALLETRPAHPSTATLGAALTQLLGAADAAQALVDAPPPAPPPAAEEPAPEHATQPHPGQMPAREPARDRKASAEQCRQLEALLEQASTALANGQLAALQLHLQATDALLAAKGTQWPMALHNRKQALRAEQARLKGWQAWGGERAREDLIAQAEALARLVQPPDTVFAPEQAAAPGAEQDGVKELSHSAMTDEAVQGAEAAAAPCEATDSEADAGPHTTSDAGDDAALAAPAWPAPPASPVTATTSDEATAPTATTAPVSAPGSTSATKQAERRGPARHPAPSRRPKLNLRAHAEAIRALRMRWKALDKLGEGAHGDLWQRFDGALTTAYQPVAAQNAAQQAARQQNLLARQDLLGSLEALALPASNPGMPAAEAANGQAAWRDLARQLDAFQVAWRQLGPVEHTAPADARQPLRQRLQAALDRIEQPLRQARDRAAAEREQLIQRAQALADGRALPGGELQRELRALQAEWQEHARSLPLPRDVENALWTRFRSATDAVFAQRDAAAAARDAEQAAEVAEREALIQRLQALHAHTPVTQIENTLGDVDRAWHQAPALLPRATGQALETRYRDARAVASGLAATAVRLCWQAQVDAWMATLQAAAGAASVNTAAGPAAQPDAHRIDDLLLQLEIALDLPAAPEWQAARQQLKLRALKEAMEGRTPPPNGPAPAARGLATLLHEPALDDLQRQRLLAVLTALRDAEPGTLGLAFPMT